MKNLSKKIIVILSLVGIILLGVLLINIISRREVIIYLNEEEITLSWNSENKIINLETFNSETDSIIKKGSGIVKINVNGKELKDSDKINLGKIQINKDTNIKVNVQYINGKTKEFIINTLPSTFPEYSVEGKSEYEGDYYTSTYSFEYDDEHYIFKLDEARTNKIL